MRSSADYSISPPNISMSVLPEPERAATWTFTNSIGRLASLIDDFGAALDLFELSEFLMQRNFINPQFRRWMTIAARDGAMTIAHFGRVLVHSGRGLKDCHSLRKSVRHEMLSSARRRFSRSFPKADEVRHATAHRAEMTETIGNIHTHAFDGSLDGRGIKAENVRRLTISDGLLLRHFTASYEGERLRYEIPKQR